MCVHLDAKAASTIVSSVLKASSVLMAATIFSMATAGEISASSAATPDRPLSPQRNVARLEVRVAVLTRALDLEAKQQSRLRGILESQRDQVRMIWDDELLPASYRVIETKRISDRTADDIRAMLNEEQRKKFNPPRPAHLIATGASVPGVEAWMTATRPK